MKEYRRSGLIILVIVHNKKSVLLRHLKERLRKDYYPSPQFQQNKKTRRILLSYLIST